MTVFEPCGRNGSDAGGELSDVALVEDQLSVTDWPLWTIVGWACRVTVGRRWGWRCWGAGAGGGAVATGCLHPTPTKTNASKRIEHDSSERTSPHFTILLKLPAHERVVQTCIVQTSNYKPSCANYSGSTREICDYLFRRPVGRFVLPLRGQLARLGSVGEHGPDLPRARARGLEHEVPSVGRPAGPFVAPGVARQLAPSACVAMSMT